MIPNIGSSSFEEWQNHCAGYGVSVLNDSKRNLPTQKQLDFERKQKEDFKKEVAAREQARRERQEQLMTEFINSLSR